MTTIDVLDTLRRCTSGHNCGDCRLRGGIDRRTSCVALLLAEAKTAIENLLEVTDAIWAKKKEAEAERDALREKVTQWISVEDRLPEDRGDVLVVAYWHERWGVHLGWCARERGAWSVHVGFADRSDLTVTHWMPLPEAPEEGEKA